MINNLAYDYDPREEARYLFEVEGLPCSEISKILGIKHCTVKQWRRRDKWVTNNISQTHGHNPNSIKALMDNQAPQLKAGNKASLKHGLYTDTSNDPKYKEFYEMAKVRPCSETLKDIFAQLAAHIMVCEANDREAMDLPTLELFSEFTLRLCNIGLKLTRCRGEELDNALKEQKLEE